MRLRQIKISPPSYWISRPTRRQLLLSVKKLILFTKKKATPDFKMHKAYEETSSESFSKIKDRLKGESSV